MDEQMNTNSTPGEAPKKEGAGPGATLAIIVILLLILAGGWYYFTNIGSLTGEPAATVEDGSADVAALEAQGTSDNVADIEADVNATDLSGLDSAAAGFGAELEAQ